MEKINLQKVRFFQNLNMPELDLQNIANYGRMLNLNYGNFLFYQGDKADNLYILLSGRIKVYKTNLRFEEIVINIFDNGESIAEMPFFENSLYPATAIVESDHANIVVFSRSHFNKIIEKYPEILFQIISSLGKKIRILDAKLESLTLLSSEQRVAKYIIEDWQKFKSFKRKDIALQLNITPEHLSRVLNKLKKMGVNLINDELDQESIQTLQQITN